MARSVQQIQSDIDTMHGSLGRPEKLVVFPDGRRVEYHDTDEKLKAIAGLEEELRKAQGGSGGRVRFAQHKRGDGPSGPALTERPGLW